MKLLVIITCVAFFYGFAQGKPQQLSKEDKEKLSGAMKDCQRATGATDADVKLLRENKVPPSHAGQCLLECIFDKTKIMQNGKFNGPSTLQVLTPLMQAQPDKLQGLSDMVTSCEKHIGKGNADKCAVAKMVAECTGKHSKDLGLQNLQH